MNNYHIIFTVGFIVIFLTTLMSKNSYFLTFLRWRFKKKSHVEFSFQTLMKHFKTIPVVEKEALSFFIYTVKTNANKLDQKNGLSSSDTT